MTKNMLFFPVFPLHFDLILEIFHWFYEFMYTHMFKKLTVSLRQMLTVVVRKKVYLVLVFLCEMPHSIVQWKPSYLRLQSFGKTLQLKHYQRVGPVKPMGKRQLDVLTSYFLLSNVFYLHSISKNIFEPKSIFALSSSKFMSIGLADNYMQERLRILMSSGLKCFYRYIHFFFWFAI